MEKRDVLYDLYWNKDMTHKEIAEKYDKSSTTIFRWFKKLKIPTRDAKKRSNMPSKEKLYNLYWNEGLTQEEIGKIYGNASKTVSSWMDKLNIPTEMDVKPSKDELYNLYWKQGMKTKEIAKKFNRSRGTVSSWLRGYNIEIRYGGKKSTAQFKKEVFELVGNEYDVLGKYVGTHTALLMRHNECGSIYKQRPHDFLDGGCRCPECFGTHKRSNGTFQKEINKITEPGEYTVIGNYVNNKTKVKIKHNKCGFVFKKTPYNFLNHKNMCPYCNDFHRRDTNVFAKEVEILTNGEYELFGEFKGMAKHNKFRHKRCGKVFECKGLHFISSNSRCPYCNQSSGESTIEDFLIKNDISYEIQKSINSLKGVNEGLLRFDFAVENDIFIEYNGKQHYEPIEHFGGEERLEYQKEHDKRKKEFCKENEYKLIEIPYWDFENIEDILTEELT